MAVAALTPPAGMWRLNLEFLGFLERHVMTFERESFSSLCSSRLWQEARGAARSFINPRFLPPQCDGTDLTAKVQDLKLQCLLFLNIPRYVFSLVTNIFHMHTVSLGGTQPVDKLEMLC